MNYAQDSQNYSGKCPGNDIVQTFILGNTPNPEDRNVASIQVATPGMSLFLSVKTSFSYIFICYMVTEFLGFSFQ